LFTSWLHGINRKIKSKIIVGASTICWAIWLTQNNIIFDKAVTPSYLQVIFRGPTGPDLVSITEGGGSPDDNDRMQEY
jgi:hypothetical protein